MLERKMTMDSTVAYPKTLPEPLLQEATGLKKQLASLREAFTPQGHIRPAWTAALAALSFGMVFLLWIGPRSKSGSAMNAPTTF